MAIFLVEKTAIKKEYKNMGLENTISEVFQFLDPSTRRPNRNDQISFTVIIYSRKI